MSKKLIPLKALERLEVTFNALIGINEYVNRDISIIKTALKELEGIKNGSIRLSVESGENYVAISKYQYEQDLKKLKALEIIKNIFPSMEIVRDYQSPQKRYLLRLKEDYCINGKITKIVLKVITKEEEYDLLKEVLI